MTTQKLAAVIAATGYESLSPAAVAGAKRALLDTVGVSLAGTAEPGSRIVAELVQDLGGKTEAGVIGRGFKSSAPLAAMANGNMAHVLDYDDVAWSWFSHASAVVAPAVLALAECRHASGKQALLAHAVGLETGARIGMAMGEATYLLGWHNTSTIGTIAAASAASKVLRLDAAKTAAALGVAASFGSGLLKAQTGTMTKPFHAGHGAKNGVLAALLAERGFTASTTALEGDFGFCTIFNGGSPVDCAKLADNFGVPWDIAEPGMTMKAYPSCRSTHPGIDAALDLRAQYHPDPAAIRQIILRTSEAVPQILRYHKPESGPQAKFCLEYCVAIVLLHGRIGVEHFRDVSYFNDPEVVRLIDKTSYVHPVEWETGTEAPQEVTIAFSDGSQISKRVTVHETKGDPNNPVTEEELIAKYRQCAAEVLTPSEVERSLQLLIELDKLSDVAALMELVTGPVAVAV